MQAVFDRIDELPKPALIALTIIEIGRAHV